MAPVRARISVSRFASIMVATYTVCLVGIGLAHRPWILVIVLPIAGVSWTAVGAVMLSQAQQMLPAWVRARGMAYYLMASQGGIAAGAFAWGAVGGLAGVSAAFFIAAVVIAVVLAFILRGGLPDAGQAEPGAGWPLPEADLSLEQLDRKARVSVTWQVPEDLREAFIAAMHEVRRSRRRTGGRQWALSSDVENPEMYVESWTVDSWHDHLEQHEVRQALVDMQASAAVRDIVGHPIRIQHYVDVMD
jgi:MFS family permease